MSDTLDTYTSNLINHSAIKYNTHADFVYSSKFTSPILDLLQAQPGQNIVDLGCGTGELTKILRQRVGVDGHVVGIDSSKDMLETARVHNEGLGIEFLQGDIQEISQHLDPAYKNKFDVVFSSAVFHWCKANPGGVIESVKWLLKPNGRLVWEMGGFGNAVGVRSAIHQVLLRRGINPLIRDPWYFPTVSQYTQLLNEHGMAPDQIQLVPRPTPLTTDLAGWLQTFARRTFSADLDETQAGTMMEEVTDICRPDCYWSDDNPGIGQLSSGDFKSGWGIMYVRLRGSARLHEKT